MEMDEKQSRNEAIIVNQLNAASPPSSFRWIQSLELGYALPPRSLAATALHNPETSSSDTTTRRVRSCFHCGKQEKEIISSPADRLQTCAKCQIATYCSRDCQVSAWKNDGHKKLCPQWARFELKKEDNNNSETPSNDYHYQLKLEYYEFVKEQIVWTKIRYYACPMVVRKYQHIGKGLLFLQSPSTLTEMSTERMPQSQSDQQRQVLLYYLTLGEFDSEVCRHDFELAQVRSSVQTLLDTYDPHTQVVGVMKFRCGHLAVGTLPLVPDFALCEKLAQDYYGPTGDGPPALQLNLDDAM